jgi:hypothetical protein
LPEAAGRRNEELLWSGDNFMKKLYEWMVVMVAEQC